MAKGRKARTFRKKIRGGQEENKSLFSPIDISKLVYKPKISESPLGKETIYGETYPIVNISTYTKPLQSKKSLSTMVDDLTLSKDDIMGGKLRRTRKRRMTKRRKGVKKMTRKSRKMRGGGLWNWLTGKKEQEYDNITTFSPEYTKQMEENMNKYNQQKQ